MGRSECVAWLVGSSPRMHKAQAGFSLQYSKTKHRGIHLGDRAEVHHHPHMFQDSLGYMRLSQKEKKI